ncbi:dTDP-4-dehydrorhamnose 3,5-epimerase [candidate division KSB1 bacterium]|nr:MAG: dTDP-4-dehydrorhamnose 3,5-epimerase [candidate division KSB1 bacterium]
MIHGVVTHKLRLIPDERGRLLEILRTDWEFYLPIAQVYMTTNYPGVVKAWHFHKKQTDQMTCVKGMVKVVLYDGRQDSPTFGQVQEFFVGEHNPMLIQIPAGVYHGWKCISESESVVVNCPTGLYDYKNPDEHRAAWDDPSIPYNWEIQYK